MFQNLSPQRLIGLGLLLAGAAYGAALLYQYCHLREEAAGEKGRWPILGLCELVVYFISTLGISDFLQNTLVIKAQSLTDDKKLPGTLVACGLVPGAVIAFMLLRADNPVDIRTLLPCVAAVIIGTALGGRLVKNMDGKRIKSFMRIALILSLLTLVLKIILTRGAAGEATSLNFYQMIPAVLLAFTWGVVTMLGIPMKPAGTALFLLLGLTPLSTLTLVLVIGCLAPLAGGVQIIKSRQYHQKLAVSSVIFGSIGAVLGSLFAISISQTLLNILLLIVMLIAILSMFRK